MNEVTNICLSSCRKVFVERNYKNGIYKTCFTEQMPEQLHSCVSG